MGYLKQMTLQELMDYGTRMMENYPSQKDLIFIGIDDCLERCDDGDELIEKMHEWIKHICEENSACTQGL